MKEMKERVKVEIYYMVDGMNDISWIYILKLEFRYEFQTKVEKYQDKIKKKLYLYKWITLNFLTLLKR